MDRKHIKFSVDAQEYQKLLKEKKMEKLKDRIERGEETLILLKIAKRDMAKLIEENKKLKKDIKDIQEIWVKSRDYGNQMFVENEKLKEENERLKEENEEFKKDGWQQMKEIMRNLDMIADERDRANEELQEENEELKKDIGDDE